MVGRSFHYTLHLHSNYFSVVILNDYDARFVWVFTSIIAIIVKVTNNAFIMKTMIDKAVG